jgi:hypothetical protein
MKTAITNRQLYPAIAGGILVSLICGVALKIIYASQHDATAEIQTSVVVEAEPSADPFESAEPFFQPSEPRLADPGLLRSTPPQARAEVVVAGRPDPFAPIVSAPVRPVAQTTVASVSPIATAQLPQPVVAAAPVNPQPLVQSPVQPALPVVTVANTQRPQMLPPLPPVPVVPGAEVEPNTVAVAPTESMSWGSPVDRVIVSGVAQIGSSVNVIVHETGNATSRRVVPGDWVGQVQIKSVDLSDAEPVVVLSYNGQDYYRSVGSASLMGTL